MDWHGGHPDGHPSAGFGFSTDTYSYHPSFPPVENSMQYWSSDVSRHYYNPHNSTQHDNEYFQNSYPLPHVQDPASVFQPSVVLNTVTPRVHINPNFRPKLSSRPDNETVPTKVSSVHINPHWKGQAETMPTTKHGFPREKSNQECNGKKTIFVNPKVLARIRMESHAQETKSSLDSQNPSSILNPVQEGTFTPYLSSNCLSLEYDKDLTQCKSVMQEEEKSVLPAASQKGFVVISSTKLVRKPKVSALHEQCSVNLSTSKTSHHGDHIQPRSDDAMKRYPSSPALKIAKQVCSKYRLVRNTSSAHISPKFRGTHLNTSRRSRRKSINLKLIGTSRPNSVYRYIRNASAQQPASRSPPIVAVEVVTSNLPSVHKSDLNNPTQDSKGSARKSVRTRYKLIKIQPSEQGNRRILEEIKKSRLVQTRHKLIQMSSLQSRLISRPSTEVVSASGFPHQSFIKSRYKISRGIVKNKIVYGRKVSRFRIIQASNIPKQLIKTPQNLFKIRKNYGNLSLGNLGMQNPRFYGNMIWQKGNQLHPTSRVDHASFSSAVSVKKERRTIAASKSNRSLLNISGVLYRSTRTTLTRTHPGKPKERIVSIRGKKFILDSKGTTLRPTTDIDSTSHSERLRKSSPHIARIDIGGVTFTRASDNTLVRTNTHYARNLLSVAKMRSIALLTQKLRKNNEPCLIYHRFGVCRAHKESKCWRVHDPRNISICQKFLQGKCEVQNCPLSHNVGPEKMPTCRYFLEGCCVRDNCPYLHVKLSARAAICRQFLQGYCEAGDTCKKRHVYLCPDFEQDGKCHKGKYCPYPHPKSHDKVKPPKETRSYLPKRPKSKVKTPCENVVKDSKSDTSREAEKRKRYYDESSSSSQSRCETKCSQDPDFSKSNESDPEFQEENDGERDQMAQRKPKIGILPAYIPL